MFFTKAYIYIKKEHFSNKRIINQGSEQEQQE